MAAKIERSTLQFLKTLAKNNNREWFTENKDHYISAQNNVIDFVENLIEETSAFDEDILKIDAKKSLFRIYRDTRFSKDKTPYKTNFGASLGMKKGSKVSGYYLHIEPGKSFLAGGAYQPESTVLKEIRKEIAMSAEEFQAIINEKDFKKYFGTLSQNDKLVNVPQGFEKDHKMAEYLKLKSFIVLHPLDDNELLDANAAKKFAKIYKAMKPLNDFLETPFI